MHVFRVISKKMFLFLNYFIKNVVFSHIKILLSKLFLSDCVYWEVRVIIRLNMNMSYDSDFRHLDLEQLI